MIPSDKPIILVGMMGCGKTTIGRGLAAALERRFIDSDREIEKTAGKTITEMFKSEGEAAFRSLEKNVIKRLLKAGNTVIATGGGSLTHGPTRALIRENAFSIWLKGNAEVYFERALKGGRRPLLEGAGAKEKFMALYRIRRPVYAQADFHVANDNASAKKTIEALDQFLKTVNI